MDEGVALAILTGTNGSRASRASLAHSIRCSSSSIPGGFSLLPAGSRQCNPGWQSADTQRAVASTGSFHDRRAKRPSLSTGGSVLSFFKVLSTQGVLPDFSAAIAASNPTGKQSTFQTPAHSRFLSTHGPMVPDIQQEVK